MLDGNGLARQHPAGSGQQEQCQGSAVDAPAVGVVHRHNLRAHVLPDRRRQLPQSVVEQHSHGRCDGGILFHRAPDEFLHRCAGGASVVAVADAHLDCGAGCAGLHPGVVHTLGDPAIGRLPDVHPAGRRDGISGRGVVWCGRRVRHCGRSWKKKERRPSPTL